MSKILLSFDVEEFDMPLEYGHDISFQQQLEIGFEGMNTIAPLLNEVPTTLFTTANFADHFPASIKKLSDKHEIASHTYYHSSFKEEDLLRSRLKLEEVTGKKIVGLRMPRMQATKPEPVLAAGFAYDASIHPAWIPGRYNNLSLPRLPYEEKGLLRLPASVTPTLRIPLFWLSFKCFPYKLYNDFCLRTLEKDGHLSLYYHPWEFTDLERSGLPYYTRKICGQALVDRLMNLVYCLLKEGQFITMADFANVKTDQIDFDGLNNNNVQEIHSRPLHKEML